MWEGKCRVKHEVKLIWIATSISVKRHVAHGVGDGNCIILNRNYLRHSNWDNVKVLLRSLLIRVEGKNVKLAFSQIHFQLTSYFSLTPYKIFPRKRFCMLFFFFLAQLELDENFFFAFWATFHCWCFFYYSFFLLMEKLLKSEEKWHVAFVEMSWRMVESGMEKRKLWLIFVIS